MLYILVENKKQIIYQTTELIIIIADYSTKVYSTILSAGQSPAFSFACKSYRNSGNRANHQEGSEFVKKETERPVRVTPEKDDPRRKKQETQQHGCPAKCP